MTEEQQFSHSRYPTYAQVSVPITMIQSDVKSKGIVAMIQQRMDDALVKMDIWGNCHLQGLSNRHAGQRWRRYKERRDKANG